MSGGTLVDTTEVTITAASPVLRVSDAFTDADGTLLSSYTINPTANVTTPQWTYNTSVPTVATTSTGGVIDATGEVLSNGFDARNYTTAVSHDSTPNGYVAQGLFNANGDLSDRMGVAGFYRVSTDKQEVGITSTAIYFGYTQSLSAQGGYNFDANTTYLIRGLFYDDMVIAEVYDSTGTDLIAREVSFASTGSSGGSRAGFQLGRPSHVTDDFKSWTF